MTPEPISLECGSKSINGARVRKRPERLIRCPWLRGEICTWPVLPGHPDPSDLPTDSTIPLSPPSPILRSATTFALKDQMQVNEAHDIGDRTLETDKVPDSSTPQLSARLVRPTQVSARKLNNLSGPVLLQRHYVDELANWRIDPSLIEFLEDTGWNGTKLSIVSRALLASTADTSSSSIEQKMIGGLAIKIFQGRCVTIVGSACFGRWIVERLDDPQHDSSYGWKSRI